MKKSIAFPLWGLLVCCSFFNRLNAESQQIQTSNQTVEPNEIWWEKNLGDQVSYKVFGSWLGGIDAPSRVAMRNHLKTEGYETMLDVACGLGTDYLGIQKERLKVKYLGLDITPKLVSFAQSLGITVHRASAENIPLVDGSVEFVYARHLLEHLPNYKTALNEMLRVATKEVCVIFFIRPTSLEYDLIKPSHNLGCLLFHNEYSLFKIETFLRDNPKTRAVQWQDINEQEVMLHVYLKN